MNKLAMLIPAVIVFCVFSLSCSPSSEERAYSQLLNDDLKAAKSEIQDLNQKVTRLEADYQTLQASKETLQKNYNNLQADDKTLQDRYNKFLDNAGKTDLNNVAWPDVVDMLKRDETNNLKYQEGVFEREGFALKLRDNLAKAGVRCAYVSVKMDEAGESALNAFNTTDRGIIYVDCAGSDSVAYVQKNKPYGTIRLDSLKNDYIVCEGSPEKFWGEPVWNTHDDVFSYDYYQLYIQRWEFYDDSLLAYNKAKIEFDKGWSALTDANLANWKANLALLKQNLGPGATGPGRVVKNIEIYWN